MKKIAAFILTIFTVATLFAAALPSLDGRAVVADQGTMPRGFFARTVGYLPGDSVTVTNPESGISTEVLVLGAIDPSEGVAILLSPEAAEALKITPGSNVQVKLTKRSGSIDENANGSAVLSKDSSDEDSELSSDEPPDGLENTEAGASEAEISESSVPSEEIPLETLPELPGEDAENSEIPGAEPLAEENPVEEAVAPETSVPETTAEENSVPEAVSEEVPAEESVPSEPINEEIHGAEVSETPVEEKLDETPSETSKNTSGNVIQPVEIVTAAPEAEEESVEMLPVHEEELPALSEDEKNKTDPLQPVVVVEAEPEKSGSEPVENPESVDEEIPAPVEESPAVAEKAEETAPSFEEEPAPAEETVVLEPSAPEAEKEPEVVAEKAEEPSPVAEPVEDDAFQPIVLVPTEMNPPENDGKAGKTDAAADVKNEPAKTELAEEAREPVKEPAPSAKPAVSNDWRNYVVPSHKNLVKGRYYIQIASLSKESNIKNLIEKYSSKYPMVLIESMNGKSYQVMVGPLNIDEYGSVLEKMKASGYKDAFVKKIN